MNALTWSESLAAGFWPIFTDAATKGALLLLLATVALPCLRRSSASSRHLALLLVVGGLLVLPLLSWLLPRVEVLPAKWNPTAAFTPRPLLAPRQAGSAQASPRPSAEMAQPAIASTPATPAPVPLLPQTHDRLDAINTTLAQWIPLVWALGMICALAPVAAGLLSLWRLRRTACRPAPAPLQALLRQLSPTAGRRRHIQLLITESRQMPMTWGALRPKILLPAEAPAWPEHRQRAVLLHELAHIQRADFLATLAVRFTCALYWFNPLVWLAARRLRLEQEQACDDLVLAAGAQPDSYAEEVLRVAAGASAGRLEVLGALTMARASTLEERLRAILDDQRNRRSLSRRIIGMTTLLATLALIPLSMLHAGPNAAAATPAPTGLVAWWRAERNGEDSAGHHDGEFPFGIRYTDGAIGKAFDFRRTYQIEYLLQRVSIPDSPDFQLSETLTLEARIYPLNYGGIILLRGDDRPGFDTWQLDLLTPGKISFNFDDAENNSDALLAPLQLSRWHHVVVTFDRGEMKIYLNGALAAEAQTRLRPNPILDPKQGAALGIGNTGGKTYNIPFDGLIDEVKIYNRALTAAEVAQNARK